MTIARNRTIVAALALSLGLMQSALALNFDQPVLLAEVSNSSGEDDLLFRPRWSLPLNSGLGKLETTKQNSPHLEASPPRADDNSSDNTATDKTSSLTTKPSHPAKLAPVERLTLSPDRKSPPSSPAAAIPATIPGPRVIIPSLSWGSHATEQGGDTNVSAEVRARSTGSGGNRSNVSQDSTTPAGARAAARDNQVSSGQDSEMPQVQDVPVHGTIPDTKTGNLSLIKPGQVIQTGVSIWDTANIDKVINNLVDAHCNGSDAAKQLDKRVAHFSSLTQQSLAITKDSFINNTFKIQGTDPSQRGGKLVLDEDVKSRDKTSAEYERQKYVDKIHSQIVSSLSQIAMGLGVQEPIRREQIMNSGYHSLTALVGDDQAKTTVQGMTTWLERVKVPPSTFDKPAWDSIEREAKLEMIIKAALDKDPVVNEIKRRVQKMAHPGQIKSNTSRVVETTLQTAAWLAPGFAIPIGAEAALDSYVAATGGTEERKLEKELVYDKRIQDRLKVLDKEASLALDNYRFALVTKNTPLLAFSEALTTDLSNDQVANEVLNGQVLSSTAKDTEKVIPGIKESKDAKDNDGIANSVHDIVTHL